MFYDVTRALFCATGVDRFSSDLEQMLGFKPGIFWRLCWKFISPFFLIVSLILAYSYVSNGPYLYVKSS